MSVTEITDTRQYLTFRLGDEVFATDVAKVREVLDFTTITKIPRTPDFMSGVINLRGNVVPVVDLRLCFEMSKTEKTVNTCIVVVEMLVDGESNVIGALGRLGRRGDRSGAGAHPASAPHRHQDPDGFYQRDGQARLPTDHDPGYRPRILYRRVVGVPRRRNEQNG